MDKYINKVKNQTNNKINDMYKVKSTPNVTIEKVELTPNVNVEISKEIVVPREYNGYKQYIMDSFTPYKKFVDNNLWDKTSSQYKLSQEWLEKGAKSDRGIAIIDGRYLVAMTEYYGNV